MEAHFGKVALKKFPIFGRANFRPRSVISDTMVKTESAIKIGKI
jgi:hypothetical protein